MKSTEATPSENSIGGGGRIFKRGQIKTLKAGIDAYMRRRGMIAPVRKSDGANNILTAAAK